MAIADFLCVLGVWERDLSRVVVLGRTRLCLDRRACNVHDWRLAPQSRTSSMHLCWQARHGTDHTTRDGLS